MTIEEKEKAIYVLKNSAPVFPLKKPEEYNDYVQTIKQVIDWLEQESILDKIKAEIFEEKEHAYANFEAYKIDYLMQDEEDVLDSLPQDDFRYGMERAIEIINKYKGESEGKVNL